MGLEYALSFLTDFWSKVILKYMLTDYFPFNIAYYEELFASLGRLNHIIVKLPKGFPIVKKT